MKLIKINEEHYVVVDDLQISIGDWIYEEGEIFQAKIGEFYCDKITHSTEPLELLSENGLSGMGFSKVRPLNVFEVKELIGEVDVEKKMISPYPINTQNDVDWCNGYQRGYNQALEDNKDKKYTEEDMFRVFCLGNKLEKTNFDDENFSVFFNMFKKHIQSLQPKTEWEVEIVDGKLKIK